MGEEKKNRLKWCVLIVFPSFITTRGEWGLTWGFAKGCPLASGIWQWRHKKLCGASLWVLWVWDDVGGWEFDATRDWIEKRRKIFSSGVCWIYGIMRMNCLEVKLSCRKGKKCRTFKDSRRIQSKIYKTVCTLF